MRVDYWDRHFRGLMIGFQGVVLKSCCVCGEMRGKCRVSGRITGSTMKIFLLNTKQKYRFCFRQLEVLNFGIIINLFRMNS
jgi:hypothetical protein